MSRILLSGEFQSMEHQHLHLSAPLRIYEAKNLMKTSWLISVSSSRCVPIGNFQVGEADGYGPLSIYISRQEAVSICEVGHSHNLENVQQMQI